MMIVPPEVVAEDESNQRVIRAGAGCHVVSRHQATQAGQRRRMPSFESIANRADVTANTLLKMFNDTHRNKDAPQATSISATTYIAGLETSEVIAYLLMQKYRP
jgi:hypothetical protein